MRGRILFALTISGILLCHVHGLAQWNNAITRDSAKGKFAVGIYANLDFSSNCITNQFAANFASGNYINDNLKQQVVNRMQNINHLGFLFNYGIYGVLYNDTIKKHPFNIFFALRHKDYLNIAFTPDVFKIAFYGNAPYAGQTANFSPFSMNNLAYQQAEIGLVCKSMNGVEFGAGLSFLVGQQLMSINAPSASLYTDPTGQYLSISSNAQMHESDTTPSVRNNQAAINGYGASLDLFFRMPYKIWGKAGRITLSATDIGFISWNDKSLYYNRDTTYQYNGININGISGLQNGTFNTLNKDSIRNKYLPLHRQAFTQMIPGTLSLNTNTNMGKWHLEAGLRYIYNANYDLYGYLQGDKYFVNGWMVALQLGYGGYDTFNSELILSKQLGKGYLRIALNHLQGLVASDYFGGAGAFVEYYQAF